MLPRLLLHGGAGRIPKSRSDDALAGVSEAAQAGWAILQNGGSAVDAVCACVQVMENDPRFNAGRGSVLNALGQIRQDAALQCGKNLAVGGVIDLPGFVEPSRIARALLDEPGLDLLAGEGALQYAQKLGMEPAPLSELVSERRVAEHARRALEVAAGQAIEEEQPLWGEGDTVGAVAVDARGHCAAITSTGGTSFKALGRVGDSALVGAGLAADDQLGATSSTGIGEEILRTMLCADALMRLRHQRAPHAAAQACDRLRDRLAGRGGLVLLDRHGDLGIATTTESMSWALMDGSRREPLTGVKVPELNWQLAQNKPG